ncbi:MAG TPA: hypothetical protein VIM34_18510, partial [Burkholderiaceae bacterium]
PPVQIRPAPLSTFRGRSGVAAVSPESARVMARLGIGLLIIAQKPQDKTLVNLENYRQIYREVNGVEVPEAAHRDSDRLPQG